MRIIKIDSCLSTNLLLKERAAGQGLEEGTVLVAREQTAGRGQIGNRWEAEAGKNLTFSLIFYPNFLEVKNGFLLSEAVSLGVKKVLEVYTGAVSIKWPNDIYHKDKKMAGILIENEIMGQTISQSIAGIGINVNQEIFRSDAPNPVSLKQITGKHTDLDCLLETVAASVLSCYKQLQNGESKAISRAYHEALFRKEGFFPYKVGPEKFLARIERVANNGFLHLITDAGEKRCYAFKEVSFTI